MDPLTIVALVVSAISAYMAYRAFQNMPQAHDEGAEPKTPVVEEGKVIGVVFGTVKITGSTVYWWGDVSGEAIKK